MELIYKNLNEGGQHYIEITGVQDAPRTLRIPYAIDGVPVRIIGSHAFEKTDGLRQIILPDSVRAVGTFAFYGCQDLQVITLTDMTESWGTGSIYFCGNLSEIQIRVTRKRYSVLRDMLSDIDSGLYVKINEPDFTAKLYFPAFTHGFDEDTYARAFHTWIEGCGFAYRETVMRSGIDFRGYDQLFMRAVADGVGGMQNAANIAMARLMYPCSMKPAARDMYEEFLTKHGEEVLLRLIEEHDRERSMFLLDAGFIPSEAAKKAVPAATRQGDAELVAMLMRQRGEELNRGFDTTLFDLEDL